MNPESINPELRRRIATRRRASGLMRLLRIPYDWMAFYLSLVVLGVCCLSWCSVAFVLRRFVSRARGHVIGRRAISMVFRWFFKFTAARGVRRVEFDAIAAIDQSEALIIAPNHPSVLDALLLVSRLDHLNCIMKASILDNIFLGAGARLAGYIRNDGPRRMLRLAASDLRRGGQVIIFPEGTRTVEAPVNEFKGGFAAIARNALVPVQTVLIETNTPYLGKGWPVLKKPPVFPMVFRARLGQRFEVKADTDAAAFAHMLRAYFGRELADAELGDLQPRGAGSERHSYG